MQIKSVELKNFRGIRQMRLEFNARVNVLAGVNGAGKSSVLDALAILLSWLPARIRRAGGTGRPISELDIRNKTNLSLIEMRVKQGDSIYSWSLAKQKRGHKIEEKSRLEDVSRLARQIQWEMKDAEAPKYFLHPIDHVPLLAYYPIERNILDVPLRIRKKHSFNLLDAYEGALSSGANFRLFFEWFRELEDLENEQLRDEPDNGPDPQLDAVRTAIKAFIGFSEMRVRRNPLRMEVMKAGRSYDIRQLSGGEKCTLALVGDLARRLAIANPDSENPLGGNGIVLIDEIDMHLHPQWQRMVVPRLQKTFPGCQFILSTHSPHVLNRVEPKNIFLLSDTEEGIVCSKPDESYGKTSDRILEDLMGLESTRPQKIADALHELFATIQEGDLEMARQQVAGLKGQIGEDPELVKAEVLMKRREILGK